MLQTASGPPEPKIICSTFPGPALPTDATPRPRSVLRGPSPRRGNASGFRLRGARARRTRRQKRARTAHPRPRSAPPTSTRSFVSRRHKSRGDSRSRIGLQCGQVVVREGAQRPGIKVYVRKRRFAPRVAYAARYASSGRKNSVKRTKRRSMLD